MPGCSHYTLKTSEEYNVMSWRQKVSFWAVSFLSNNVFKMCLFQTDKKASVCQIGLYINPFPPGDAFWRNSSRQLSKTLWPKVFKVFCCRFAVPVSGKRLNQPVVYLQSLIRIYTSWQCKLNVNHVDPDQTVDALANLDLDCSQNPTSTCSQERTPTILIIGCFSASSSI